MQKFYITTAIDYVNNLPHLGTAYEKIGADVIARYKRLAGFDVLFLMGNDEHSANVEKRAIEKGILPEKYCDDMELEFRAVWKKLNISFDDFIRTTQKRHIDTVKEILQRIYQKGDIYKGKYEGWYCVSCEAFYQEKELKDKKCPVHNKEPQWLSEDNYFFALSKYQKPLEEYYKNHPEFVQPEIRRNEMLGLLKEGLTDISISRSSIKWGVPLPFDSTQVTYVWFDALINYISAVSFVDSKEKFDKYWPCDMHIIGKDITRFHCIIWPAMLMSAGIELPKMVWGHGFVNLSGEKMSKTTGTIINPLQASELYGADSLRYFLMREVPFDRDGDFSWERFKERFNSDLANDLGNLVRRTLTMIEQYQDGIVLPPAPETEGSLEMDLKSVALDVAKRYQYAMDKFELHNGLNILWELVRRANAYIEETTPWLLAKDKLKKTHLATVLYNLAEALRFIAILSRPFIPEKSESIWKQLCIADDIANARLSDLDKWGGLKVNTKINKGEALFPRIEEKKEKVEKSEEKIEDSEGLTIEEFQKIDLRVAQIEKAERVPKADKLIRLEIIMGEERRQIVAGIAQHYTPEELIGKKIVVVANLKKAKIKGIESHGMLLAGTDKNGKLSIITIERDIETGAKVK